MARGYDIDGGNGGGDSIYDALGQSQQQLIQVINLINSLQSSSATQQYMAGTAADKRASQELAKKYYELAKQAQAASEKLQAAAQALQEKQFGLEEKRFGIEQKDLGLRQEQTRLAQTQQVENMLGTGTARFQSEVNFQQSQMDRAKKQKFMAALGRGMAAGLAKRSSGNIPAVSQSAYSHTPTITQA
jgi:chromosome segregation ATPase